MKLARNLLLCLAGGLALNAPVRADNAMLAGNPYAPVVARNIFGLNPLAPVDPNAAADATPPPKITPNGITDILGQLEVLFKVATPAKAGKPAKEDDYILSEGQRQDDIEVLKIDEPGGIVTFNNHGQTQELPLVTATATSPAPAAGGNHAPGFHPPPGFHTASGGFPRPAGTTFNGHGSGAYDRNYAGNNTGMENNGMNNSGGMGNGLNFGGTGGESSSDNGGHASVKNPLADQNVSGVTPEVQTIEIEANRIATQEQVERGELPPLPITVLTPGADLNKQ